MNMNSMMKRFFGNQIAQSIRDQRKAAELRHYESVGTLTPRQRQKLDYLKSIGY